MPKFFHKPSSGELPSSSTNHSSSHSTNHSTNHSSSDVSSHSQNTSSIEVPQPNPPQPGDSAQPPPGSGPGGASPPLSLIGSPVHASTGVAGFASTAPAAMPAGGAWSMKQSITTPTHPPGITFAPQTSGAANAQANQSTTTTSAMKPSITTPTHPPNSGANTQPTSPAQPGQPPNGQPGADASNPDSSSSDSSSQPSQPSPPDGTQPSGAPPQGSPNPGPPPSPDPSQPDPNAPNATPQDIAQFKHAGGGDADTTESDWIQHLKQTDPQRYGHIPDDELLSIIRYTGSYSDPLNLALRDPTTPAGSPWKGYERTLNAALAKLPKFRGVVIRGASLPPAIDQKYQKGQVVSDPAFLSTAAASESPLDFLGTHELVIKSKTGRYVEDLSLFGHHGFDPNKPKTPPTVDPNRESEVLFASDTKFLVKEREEIEEVWDPKQGKSVSKYWLLLEEV